MTAGGTMADRGAMMNGDIQNPETQQVSTISCMARTAGYRDKTLRINTLHERALKAFRSAGLREDESERALNERDQNTGGKRGGLGWRELWEAMRAFRHTAPSRKAHMSCSTDYPNILNHAFPLGASLNTGQKIYCA